jgi:Na+-translocating ferredoxin:NAD+ oxidoreductase subunit E
VNNLNILTRGLIKENPVYVMMLGMCPTLACSTSTEDAMGLGTATALVLLFSNVTISLIKNLIPRKIKIPCLLIVIATLTTVMGQIITAWGPPFLKKDLGIFIPLIVVNCIVVGRAEAFASKNGVVKSFLDGLGMGLGFLIAITALGTARDFIYDGTLLGVKFIPGWDIPFLLPIQPVGAFLFLGMFMGIVNYIQMKHAKKKGKIFIPKDLNCRHCNMCNLKDD